MPVFHYKNRQMAYLDVGSGPVLLFGHSYLWDAQMWAPQVEALSVTIAVSCRTCGRTANQMRCRKTRSHWWIMPAIFWP